MKPQTCCLCIMTQLGEEHRPASVACLDLPLSGDVQMLMYRYKGPTNVHVYGQMRGERRRLPVIWIVMRDERWSGDSHVMMRCRCLAHYRSVERNGFSSILTCTCMRSVWASVSNFLQYAVGCASRRTETVEAHAISTTVPISC